MIVKLIETERFIKKANKLVRKNKYLDTILESVLSRLITNPFDPSLHTHKLKGKLSEFYSASVTYDLRIIFQIIEDDETKCILLLTIGKHDEVY